MSYETASQASPTINQSKRRRRKPSTQYFAAPSSLREELLFQKVLENSKTDVRRPPRLPLNIPSGPTFFPTVEEFEGNPLEYIDSIRPIAEKYGICKIVPPDGWNPPFCINMNLRKRFETKEQLLQKIQEGEEFGDGDEYCPVDYLKMAQNQSLESYESIYEKIDTNLENIKDDSLHEEYLSVDDLEKEYWDNIEISEDQYWVEYGNDVDSRVFGSGFPLSERGRAVDCDNAIDLEQIDSPDPKFGTDEFYKETYWNLNNIPCCPQSILRHVKVGINGINVPWVYYGNLFSTFCWHNEDNYLYSINYNHWGAPKVWYGVSNTKKDSEGFEKVFKTHLAMKMRELPDLLHHITTMFSPRLLQAANIPVCRLVQHPGEFVVTFPRAYHGGFSLGPNVGEAVNFASYNWISYGADANERYRACSRPAVFSHDRLTFTMANHLEELRSPETCESLLRELERVIGEEISLRKRLFQSGVRDVSKEISLPANRLDQLDEESANYDDKRLCYKCKHVCFFSCVACECSTSKVSCLRHSHDMCGCITRRKYMMIWSKEDEMENTLKKVSNHLQKLEHQKSLLVVSNKLEHSTTDSKNVLLQSPGSVRDFENHKDYVVSISNPSSPILSLPMTNRRLLDQRCVTLCKNTKGCNDATYVKSDSEEEGPMFKKMKETKILF